VDSNYDGSSSVSKEANTISKPFHCNSKSKHNRAEKFIYLNDQIMDLTTPTTKGTCFVDFN